MEYSITDADNKTTNGLDIGALIKHFDDRRARDQSGFMRTILAKKFGVVTVAVSGDDCFIQCAEENNMPDYWVAIGDPNASGTTDYFFDDHHTEIDNCDVIQYPQLVRILRHIDEHGARPDFCDWHTV